MGGKWRRKYRQYDVGQQPQHHRRNHHADYQSANRIPYENKLGNHYVGGPGRPSDDRERHRQTTKGNQRQNHHPTQTRIEKTPRHSDRTRNEYILRQNRSFKRYLMNTIRETCHQIEQWCPEVVDSSFEDEMDWIPEPEIVIPQPGGPMRYEMVESQRKGIPALDPGRSKRTDVALGEHHGLPRDTAGATQRITKGRSESFHGADDRRLILESPYTPKPPKIVIKNSLFASKPTVPGGVSVLEEEYSE
ncbi:hypothetical protein BP5796_04934 [Coleophoma crateriformis]|uniref:Uncharacterized protein n=1 Tax=Coleophoma crateriformis TaxID=565419 RepID=A0A3D8SAZ4_9HELO|nr:hypothetical protein BP5796_04934 [Coleophoma crateriformis]